MTIKLFLNELENKIKESKDKKRYLYEQIKIMVLDSFQEDENINEIEDPSWVVDDAVFDGLIGPSNNIEAFEFLQKFNITNFEDAMENEIYDVEGIAYYYFVKVVAEEFVKLLKQFGWLEK